MWIVFLVYMEVYIVFIGSSHLEKSAINILLCFNRKAFKASNSKSNPMSLVSHPRSNRLWLSSLIGQCKFYFLFLLFCFTFLLDHNDLPVKPWDVEPQPLCSPTPIYKCNVSCHIAKAAWSNSPFTSLWLYTSIINSNLLTTLVYMMCGLALGGRGRRSTPPPGQPSSRCVGTKLQSMWWCKVWKTMFMSNGHLFWGWGINRTECYMVMARIRFLILLY